MDKSQLDELYHLLRAVSNEGHAQQSPEIVNAIHGLSTHLLAGGDYLKLIQYCAYYGETYLLQPTITAIKATGWKPERIVEFGAGLGWLGRNLSAGFGYLPTLFIDKRQWALIDMVADLETELGIERVLDMLKPGDVIVMSDFLHCTVEPGAILAAFSKYPMAILEYMPTDEDWAESYTTQLGRYGGNPINDVGWLALLSRTGRKTDAKDLDPYALVLIDKEE